MGGMGTPLGGSGFEGLGFVFRGHPQPRGRPKEMVLERRIFQAYDYHCYGNYIIFLSFLKKYPLYFYDD